MFVKLFVFSISSCGKVSEEQKATTSTPFKIGPAVFEPPVSGLSSISSESERQDKT